MECKLRHPIVVYTATAAKDARQPAHPMQPLYRPLNEVEKIEDDSEKS